jgi:hypothetical protein
MNNKEIIKFIIEFKSDYWDLPPGVTISVDDTIKFDGLVTETNTNINFVHTLTFDQPHQLAITRYNKDDTQRQCDFDGTVRDQLLTITRIIIDGIDIKNIIQSQSFNEPIYPEPWASEQKQLGIVLDKLVIAETCFGHNGTWRLNFTSPFYKFLYNSMDGIV